MGYLPGYKNTKSKKSSIRIATIAYLGILFVIGSWVTLLISGTITLGGVPFNVLMTFWQDEISRNAYFQGNSKLLHDRLDDLGVERAMKNYYRPRIPADEVKLDQHIHQILYDRTGYVGVAYTVSSQGVLVPKDIGSLKQDLLRNN
ncbi:MAG: hypothetical protein F6K19_39240 [Cyanothece sp. SIO1E1]|nr:hypothetical protein [Cyanothece sp. SIO1E1]